MKKIFVLLLAVLLIMPVLPAYAAERTTVDVANYNSISEKVMVNIVSTATNLVSATVKIGDDIEETVYGDSKSKKYTALLDVSSLTSTGEFEVEVVADYGSGGIDTVTKTLNITKMDETLYPTTFDNFYNFNNIVNLNPDAILTANTSATKLNDEGTEIMLSWKDGANLKEDVRFGGVYMPALLPGAMYVIDQEIMFQNGDSLDVEVPNISSMRLFFRKKFEVDSASPTYSNGQPYDDAQVREVFKSSGSLSNGDKYYTNTWYKFRFVLDMATVDDAGALVGGLKYYIATADDEGNYSDFKLFQSYDYLTLPNFEFWRWDPRPSQSDTKIYFKNIMLTKQVPLSTWNIERYEYEDNKITFEFSEDMGTISGDSIKLFNQLNKDNEGNVIFEEVPAISIENVGEGKYALNLKKPLIDGTMYEIRFINKLKSASGAIAFYEPAEDENDDGYWKFDEFSTPEYPLNFESVTPNASGADLIFNNDGIGDKYAIVCWYGDEGELVDFTMKQVADLLSGGTISFERNNTKDFAEIKSFVVDFNSDSESRKYGLTKVFDIQ